MALKSEPPKKEFLGKSSSGSNIYLEQSKYVTFEKFTEKGIVYSQDKEWVDMPEFVQEKKKEFSKIIVRFEDEESLQEFSELIKQKLTPKTKSIWHPYKPHNSNLKREWKDES